METLVSSLRTKQETLGDDHQMALSRLQNELVQVQKENIQLTTKVKQLQEEIKKSFSPISHSEVQNNASEAKFNRPNDNNSDINKGTFF